MARYFYKGSPIVTPFTITSNEPFYEVETASLKIQRASQGVQRWELSFSTINTEQTEVNTLLGIVTNTVGVDTMVMPQLPSVADSDVTGIVLVGGTTAVGSTNISIDPSLASGLLPTGSFVQFANHDKIYMLTSDLDLSGSSLTTVNIFPGLRAAQSASDGLNVKDSVIFKHYRLSDNINGITFSDGVLSSTGTISVVEAI